MTNSPRPESFLRLIRRSQKGKLKIYLGYCAGVGKTYQMLQEAHRLRDEGVDVVIGWVETHGRKETDALLNGLEILPRRRMTYKGIPIEEMDLNAILSRKPEVVLVDELAHTNIPGSPNPKRYQDVEQILAHGVHVITTLNVQHLESLYDTVEKATQVRVRERIPDTIVSEADQIVNVDVTTEDLRKRLEEGKIYTEERIEVALEGFFKASNLEQLRELTLRELASQIDSKRRDLPFEEVASSPDQVMVCLSSRGPNSERLLRYASRLAGRLNRNWYAVYVQTPSENPMSVDAQTQRLLANSLTLAKELGATVFTFKGEHIAHTLLQFAKEYRVGHIVVGTPGVGASFWDQLRRKRSIVQELVEGADGITVVILDTRHPADWIRNAASPPPTRHHDEVAGSPRDAVLSRFISMDRIIFWDGPIHKESALAQLSEACARHAKGVSSEAILYAVQNREAQGSTFLNEGIALPHARVDELNEPLVALGFPRSGVQQSGSSMDIGVIFFILTPSGTGSRHIAILAACSLLSRDPQFSVRLREGMSPEDVLSVIQEWETSLVPSCTKA